MLGMRAALIDLDGVIYEGERGVSGSAEAIAWLDQQQIPFIFLTNTTSRPRGALAAKLHGLGIKTTADRILTPPVAASRWLTKYAPGPVALFVPTATVGEFGASPQLGPEQESGAAAVVLGDLGEAWDFATLNRAFRLLMAKPRPVLVALGMTRYWRAPDGLRLDVAPFVKALEHATGTQAVVLGKPAPEFFRAGLGLLECGAEDTVIIGDDIVGDVGGGQRIGLHGVLVRTGKYQQGDLDGNVTPDTVLDSIAELPAWWRRQRH